MNARLCCSSISALRARLHRALSSSAWDAGIAHAITVRGGLAVAVTWRAGGSVELPCLWLRDNCAGARDPATNQKLVSAADLPAAATTAVEAAAVAACIDDSSSSSSGGGSGGASSLAVRWSDGHASTFDARWLRALLPHNPTAASGAAPAEMHPAHAAGVAGAALSTASAGSAYGPLATALRAGAPLPEVTFEDLVGSERGALECADALLHGGLCLVTGAPTLPGVVLEVAARLGPPLRTLYGLEFNVKVDPQVGGKRS